MDKTNTDENAVANIHDVHTKSSNKTMTDDEINELVDDYRFQLENERKVMEELSATQKDAWKRNDTINNNETAL